MNVKAVGKLRQRPLTGFWYRALSLRHWKTRLTSHHSTTVTSRFSAATSVTPGHRVIYLAENHQAAMLEVGALLGTPANPVANPNGSWAIMSLAVILSNIVDLTDLAQQKVVGTNHAELTGDWLNFPGVAPSQSLGAALFNLPGLEGFLYQSARVSAKCLAIFPDKLGTASRVVFFNEITARPEVLA